MTKSEIYKGTIGITPKIAINRLFELMDKQPLGGKDKDFYTESREVIENNINKIIKASENWGKVKNNLTAKQLLKVLED